MYKKRNEMIMTLLAGFGIGLSIAALLVLSGCAHSNAGVVNSVHGDNAETYGYVSTKRAKNSQSMCFNGLMREWEHAGCNQFGWEKIEEGYYKHWCADEGATTSSDPIRSSDYFVILWNPLFNQYSRAMPDATVPVCGDPSAIIVAAERD